MKFVNRKDLLTTVGFYGVTFVFCSIAISTLFTLWDFKNSPSIQEVEIGRIPGRTFIKHEVTPGTFKIEVPWEETESWGDNAISSVKFDKAIAGFIIDSWRPDQFTEGVFEHSSKRVNIPTAVVLRWVPVSIQDGTLSVEKRFVVESFRGLLILLVIMGSFSSGFFFVMQQD